MNFIRDQIKEIRTGGLQALCRKICALPGWVLWGFGTSKYSIRMTHYGCRIAVTLKPDWAKAHALLAYCLVKLGSFDEAMDAWKRAFLLKPELTFNYNVIQWAFFVRGQTRAAWSVAQSVIDAQNSFAHKHQLDKLGVRFLREFSTHIGHIALLDSYVKMGILGHRYAANPIILAAKPANRCYLDYWRRYLPAIITDPRGVELLTPIAEYLEDWVGGVMNSSGKQIKEFYPVERAIQAQWEAEGRGHLLTLSDSDHERGWQCLRDLGVPADAWFVSLHVREGDRRENHARDADINTYRLAMESIAARGGWVIRMGDPSMTPLPPMPQVIDYAHSEVRSDWMDVFLWARCRFFVGTDSGPIVVPPTFGVPCVETNWSPLALRLWFNQNLCIFKIHWSEREARHLNFAEVISSALGWAESPDYFASHGIKLVDNTPEEINAVVIEMLDCLEGNLSYSKDDEELQERFDSLYINNSCKANARIGRGFLRKWTHLL